MGEEEAPDVVAQAVKAIYALKEATQIQLGVLAFVVCLWSYLLFRSLINETLKPKKKRVDSVGTGRDFGAEFIWWVLENPRMSFVFGISTAIIVITFQFLNSEVNWKHVLVCLIWPFWCITAPWLIFFAASRVGKTHTVPRKLQSLIELSDSLQYTYGWGGNGDHPIPMSVFYQNYIDGEIKLNKTLDQVLLHRYEIFSMSFDWLDVKFFLRDLSHNLCCHGHDADERDVAGTYNMGNDFYEWFLHKPMLYSCGMYEDENEDLVTVQNRKLDTVCRYAQMEKGDKHLDLGCGWGTLISHAAKHFGTQSLGVTLSSEQASYAEQRIKEYDVVGKAEVKVMNAWDIGPEQIFKRITCLEMSEHVGLRYFQQFMCFVRDHLEDDGIFYLQIAGLRRTWQYEDLIWGLFMVKYIFPGADASMPLGWVCTQVERAGFEVHRVENMGVHYGLTIQDWHKRWIENQKAICEKYEEKLWRIWDVFLAWSTKIALQGSSTVFMITLTKNTLGDKRTFPKGLNAPAMDRTTKWVGPNPIASQQ